MAPLVAILLYALGVHPDADAVAAIRRVATEPFYVRRIAFTVLQAIASTVLTLALGLPLAYLFATRRFPLKGALRAALTVPFVMPPLVIALALRSSYGEGATLDLLPGSNPLALLTPVGAILLAHVIYNVSLVQRLVSANLERLPSAFSDAARTLGADPLQTLRLILLPLARPAILAAALLTLLFTTTSFGIILLLGGDRLGTIETLLYEEVQSFRPHYDTAAILGILQLLLTLAIGATYLLLHRRHHAQYPPQTSPTKPLGIGGAAFLLTASMLVLVPLLSLVSNAFHYQGRWSLQPWSLAVNGTPPLGSYTLPTAAANSLLFATATMLISLVLAALTLHATRHAPRLQTWIHNVNLLPLGTSGLLIGLGLILTYDGSILPDLRSHPARIILAHVLIAYPFATRILQPALDAIPSRLHDAARTLGANPRHVLTRVDLPLARPALLAAATFAFASSLGEFGATLLLRRPETSTLPIALYDAQTRPGAAFQAQADVIGFLLALAAFLAFLGLEALRRRHPGGELA